MDKQEGTGPGIGEAILGAALTEIFHHKPGIFHFGAIYHSPTLWYQIIQDEINNNGAVLFGIP